MQCSLGTTSRVVGAGPSSLIGFETLMHISSCLSITEATRIRARGSNKEVPPSRWKNLTAGRFYKIRRVRVSS